MICSVSRPFFRVCHFLVNSRTPVPMYIYMYRWEFTSNLQTMANFVLTQKYNSSSESDNDIEIDQHDIEEQKTRRRQYR
jgi:hypothetical protein